MRKRARRLSILFLILAFVATPFFWLVARDMTSIWFAGDERTAAQRKSVIFIGLVDEVQRNRDIGRIPGSAMPSIMLSHPACDTLVVGKIRTDYPTTSSTTGSDPIYRSRAEILDFFRTVAPDRLVMRGYRVGQASKAFGSFEASVLRACIAATPFQDMCMARYERAVAAEGQRFEDGLVELGFLKVVSSPASRAPGYCYSLPQIEMAGERR